MRDKLFRLLKDSLQIYVAQIVGVLVSFGLSIIVARTLGPDGRGAYGWIMALHLLACQFAQIGADTMNRRVGATHKHLFPVLAGNSFVQAIGLGLLSAAAFYVFGYMQPVGHLYPNALFFGLLAVPFVVLASMWTSLTTAVGTSSILAVSEMMQKFLQVFFVGMFLLLVTLRVGHLTLSVFMAVLLACVYVGWSIHRQIKGAWQVRFSLWWQEKHVILTAFLAGLCWQALQRLDVLLLGHWRTLEDVGHYAVAQSLMDASLILPAAIGYVLTSRAAEEAVHRDRLRLLLASLGGVALVFGAMCAVAAVLSPWFIPLLYGAAFVPVVPVFKGLMIVAVLIALYQVAQGAVYGYARARYLFISPLVGLGVKLALAPLLIPAQGMAGAVLSSQCAFLVALCVALFIALQKRKENREDSSFSCFS